MDRKPIVITGVGIVSPVGCGAGAVVEALRAGRSGLRPVHMGEKSIIMGRVEMEGAEIEGDRSLEFAEESLREALAQAGICQGGVAGDRVMFVVGSSKGRIGNLLPKEGKKGDGGLTLDLTTFPGDTLGLDLARRSGYAGGPVLNCPAACATGIVSLVRGVYALQSKEADIVVAGSAESAGRLLLMSAFQNMGALSSDLMRPFHAERRGFNPGEGGAVFILEREVDAAARGARILARVAGWDQRSDASHITGVDPDGESLAYCINKTLRRAGWGPGDVDIINAHGTATPLNDLVEGRAIMSVFGKTKAPPVSALKPYAGHLLGASSAVELAMVLACAREGFMPGIPGLDRPDSEIPLQYVPPGGMNGCFRRILKLSLGFGGHIGAVALEVFE